MSQEERHLQILQAAVKIIATKGFWGMSLQNISDELGITEAALYHYISSKDDLLNMVLSECYDTIDADENAEPCVPDEPGTASTTTRAIA